MSSNDAPFTEKDWKDIQTMQLSSKKENPLQVGRFGIGFNTVYHITGTGVCVVVGICIVIRVYLPFHISIISSRFSVPLTTHSGGVGLICQIMHADFYLVCV